MLSTTTIPAAKAYEMIQSAIHLLDPIEFDLKDGSYSYLPGLVELDNNINDISLVGYPIQLSRSAIPKIVINEKWNCFLRVEADFSSQDSINQCVADLWNQERERFFEIEEYIVSRYARAAGRNFNDLIDSAHSFPVQRTISWENLCEFSQHFTNPGSEFFKPEFIYMDNSGGFKTRGTWRNQFQVAGVGQKEIVLELEKLIPVKGESIPNGFGDWDAYECPKDFAIFLFQSCNGNTLIAFTDPEEGEKVVHLYVSNDSCNYAKFFEA
jgi:hypothetical protein